MLTVYSMCTGDKYDPSYVGILKRMVEKHLSIPHKFVCISDREIAGIDVIPPPTDYPGWWGKIGLFAFTGPSLWMDLDVVITGSIDDFIGTDKQIRVALNWAQSGHGGCQSSVMYWDQDLRFILDKFDYDKYGCWPPSNVSPKLWGDQEFLTLLRDRGDLSVGYFDATQICSYKYHCTQQGLPDNARIVVFHGKPDPHQVSDAFVIEARA